LSAAGLLLGINYIIGLVSKILSAGVRRFVGGNIYSSKSGDE
jgi:hypothetical protein